MRLLVVIGLGLASTLLDLALFSAWAEARGLVVTTALLAGGAATLGLLAPLALAAGLSRWAPGSSFAPRFAAAALTLQLGLLGLGAATGLERPAPRIATAPAGSGRVALPLHPEAAEGQAREEGVEEAPVGLTPRASQPTRAPAPAGKRRYYRWDDGDTVAFASALEDVPPQHRSRARPVDLDEPAPRAAPAVAASSPAAREVLERLNGYRSAAGLPQVSLDPQRSEAAAKHARYLAENLGHPATAGLAAHDEDPTLPGFSPEGRAAGQASLIAFSSDGAPEILDAWMGTLFHRVPLMQPALRKVGFARARAAGGRQVYVLEVGDRTGSSGQPVLYPPDGAEGVPTHLSPGELPNPIPDDGDGIAGFPVTVSFPPGLEVTAVRAVLRDARGRLVPHALSSPEHPVVAGAQQNTVALIAADPLEPGARYRVEVSAMVSGALFERAWSFQTSRR